MVEISISYEDGTLEMALKEQPRAVKPRQRVKFSAPALPLPQTQWPIFPCQPNGKRPVTQHGFLDASDDAQQIQRWRSRFSGCNWAVSTEAAGVVVLDIDPRNGGESSLQSLLLDHGALPETYSVITPSGGRHLYFAAGAHAIRSGNDKLGRGIDVKAAGGYVLIAPSVINGAPYFVKTASPCAALPDWLAAMLTD